MCSVSGAGVSCTGSAQEWGDVAFAAFDTFKAGAETSESPSTTGPTKR